MNEGGLFQNRSFWLIWLSSLFATFAFSIFLLAQSWYVVDELGRSASLGVVLMAASIPRVLTMLLGGMLADQVRRTWILFVTNLMQVCLMLLFVMMLMSGRLDWTYLMINAMLFGFLDAFFWPASQSLIPSIVPARHLIRANSVVHGTTELAFILGPVAAGLLIAFTSYTMTFFVVAVLLFLAAVFVWPFWIREPEVDQSGQRRTWEEMKEGLTTVWHSPLLRQGALVIAILNLSVVGPMIISFPLLVEQVQGNALDLSYLEAGFSVGTFAAALMLVGWHIRHRGRLVLAAFAFTAVLFFVFVRIESLTGWIVLAGVIGLKAMFVYLPLVTMIQEQTETRQMGRVMSIVSFAAMGFEPLAFGLVAAAMQSGLSITTILSVTSWIVIGSAVCVLWKGWAIRREA
ncbi:MFS transporter [Desmospora profundinema]|uniref:MFS family permease n=1 Tax=Desmospora profundinema TaxID=1571184 RepID=A0ABU1IHA9_9BACL|nr:MFS transporter [Desmospora profundinema]MDR6224165.1 MFS family permease [Desmospora profundinema]